MTSCQDVLAEMVHTKDGSRAVREFIAQGTAKVLFWALVMPWILTGHLTGQKTYCESNETAY